jgi:hypothetical protein
MLGVMKRRANLPNQVAAFGYLEVQSQFDRRVAESVGRVFDSLFGHGTQAVIYWNLLITRKLGPGEIVEKPSQFMEGLGAIFGSDTQMLEEAMVEELRKEFGLGFPPRPTQDGSKERFVGVLERAAYARSLV